MCPYPTASGRAGIEPREAGPGWCSSESSHFPSDARTQRLLRASALSVFHAVINLTENPTLSTSVELPPQWSLGQSWKHSRLQSSSL